MRSVTALSPIAALLLSGPALSQELLPLTDAPLFPESPEVYRDASLSGGPGKDGIPSIDEPVFKSAASAEDLLDGGDRVVGIHINGEARAYPQAILVWHEIVNDVVGGENVAVTFCPLTGTALGYRRGDTTLGVSGKLVNSNLIMYDRESDSEWPQILSAAIDGPHEGQGLEEVRVVWTTWENWRDRHPETEVLSRETGYFRNYDRDPYGSYNPRSGYYADDSSLVFPVRHESERFPPKHEIFGFRTNQGAVAVNRTHLAEEKLLHVEQSDSVFLVVHDPGLDTAWAFRSDERLSLDPATIEFGADGPEHPALDDLAPVNGFEAMWFAWYALYPDTQVLGP